MRTKKLKITYISNRSNHGTQNAHDAIPRNRNAIARASMRTRQDLWRVRVEGAVVDVEAEVDDAVEGYVLRRAADLGEGEEEDHCYLCQSHTCQRGSVFSAELVALDTESKEWEGDGGKGGKQGERAMRKGTGE